MNCPHPSASPGCGVMKLYIAHWLEDRKEFQSLGLISSVTSMAWIRSLLSPRFGVSTPLLAPTSPRNSLPRSCSTRMKLQEPSRCSVRIMCCAGGHRCQERSTCIQLDWETPAPRRAEGSECWLVVQVAAGIFIWAAPLMLFNELGWVSIPV